MAHHHTAPLSAGIVLALALALAVAAPASAQAATPANTVLKPHLEVGEQLSHVFSRAISIEGAGFKEVVGRVSGTSYSTVKSIDTKGIVLSGGYRYDGRPAATAVNKILSDGITACWNGKCAADRETSGALFNRLLWGHAPAALRAGTTWTATIAEPWEIGPAGSETVRVERIDPSGHTVTLFRKGHGTGPWLHDQRIKQITITTDDGARLEVTVVPGETHWIGRTIVRDGVIVADTILVNRHVTLSTASGRKFGAEGRAYTLENLLQDRVGSS